jgi:hypothetical protein
MLFTVPSTGGFKENHTLLWFSKLLQKNPRNKKTQKDSSLCQKSRLKMPFKNSISGKERGSNPSLLCKSLISFQVGQVCRAHEEEVRRPFFVTNILSSKVNSGLAGPLPTLHHTLLVRKVLGMYTLKKMYLVRKICR